MDSISHGIRSGAKSCLYRNDKLGGVMEKLKDMWKDMSKPGKLFVLAIAAILIIVLVNYIV